MLKNNKLFWLSPVFTEKLHFKHYFTNERLGMELSSGTHACLHVRSLKTEPQGKKRGLGVN